ncbi:EF-P lysine aminoacylase GenX [Syntrophotalea acetylenivorans]|uniref:EF-P lysine aminoacylase GenX n=1 Tax=Syntrophotalea acetylenivorans TaxID=1842532 RepID=A0A1L3GS15_9BACT|nr:EF-P lysine aminoacylase GenX [Syntrophotalea acetylenivorans]APG28734.1 EF-P lysine aminoacylase GenX [Syntrophotalea acetylenivorans]
MDGNWALTRKRPRLEQRARIVQMIRAFFNAREYLEVETPQRLPGNAPEAHIDAMTSADWFLHTSPELCMKRLLAAGYEKLFQICHCWRDGERGKRHLPEFTMLEWYAIDCDYRRLMDECEILLRALAPQDNIVYQGETIDLSGPFERLTVAEAFDRYASLGLATALETNRFDELLTLEVEPLLGRDRPTFLIEYPSELAALARCHPERPQVAERFELYVAGIELANAFSELTDPTEQRRRFDADEAERRAAGKPPYPVPDKFLTELAAMPEAAGIALGLDRLVMLLTDATTIDEVVTFTPELL